MSQVVLAEIEQNILQLSDDEQLLLISRVAERLFERQLAEMANDPDIQRELKEIKESDCFYQSQVGN